MAEMLSWRDAHSSAEPLGTLHKQLTPAEELLATPPSQHLPPTMDLSNSDSCADGASNCWTSCLVVAALGYLLGEGGQAA
eukprot:2311770-Rhodomonas_salina.1